MKRRVIIRADANKTTGYGHFIRSLALADYLKNDFECYFATCNIDNHSCVPTEYQFSEINKACIPVHIVADTIAEFDKAFLRIIESTDIVVLDNYYFTTEYQRRIKDTGCKLVCIDDVHNRHMICDLLLTVCPLTRDAFSLEEYTKFVGGLEWSCLRSPFFKPKSERVLTNQIDTIVMAMGGADAYNLTDKMIGCLQNVLPLAKINVICGDTVTVSAKRCDLVKIFRRLTAEEIVELFDNSDLGIFPASTICIEALSRNLPVIAGYYVDNQVELYNYGIIKHLFAPLGCFLDEPNALQNRLHGIIKDCKFDSKSLDFETQKVKIVNLFKEL